MLDRIIAPIAAFIIGTISSLGYGGIVFLMAIESACIPLPSEIIMPFSGYLVSTGRFELVWVATAGAVGCNVGSTIAYALGYYGGRPLVEKWGAYVLMSRRDLELVDRFFHRYGSATVFISRLLPVVRTFIAFPAGIARMPQARFQIYTFLGSWPWCFALAYVGMKLGERWESDPTLRDFLHRFDALIVGAGVLAFAWYVWRHWQHHVSAPKDRGRAMDRNRAVPLAILVASAALVGGALLFQYVGGLQPCELCLYQRWPYYAMIVLSALALAAGRPGFSTAVTAIAALAFLAGAGLAFYHVGVEQHWFAGPGACTGATAAGGSIEDFRKQLMAQQPVRCDEPQWALFGVSLAGWNLLASLALVVFCLLALRSPALKRRTA